MQFPANASLLRSFIKYYILFFTSQLLRVLTHLVIHNMSEGLVFTRLWL